MAKKRKLSDLIGEETQQPEPPKSEEVKSVTTELSDSGSLSVTELQTDKVTSSKSSELTESVTNKVPSFQSSKTTESQTDKVTNSESSEVPNSPTNEEPDLQTDEVPKYLTLVRKEARLREDQLDNLTSLTRSLNRKRRGTGERITENTLIRVAVDLLLDKSDQLKGTTEQELLASVGLD